jgi:hypothetical protein
VDNPVETLNLSLQAPERLLDELIRIFPDTGTMGNDQFVEVPREQPFERPPGKSPYRPDRQECSHESEGEFMVLENIL